MSRYLTNQAHIDAIYLGALSATVQEMTTRWVKDNEQAALTHGKDSLKNLRMAGTYTTKALQSLLNDIDYQQQEIIKKNVAQYQCVATYSKQAESLRKRQSKLEHNPIVPVEDLQVFTDANLEHNPIVPVEDLQVFTDAASASCAVCESVGQEVKECKVYQLFLKYGVDVVNGNPANEGCPFRAGDGVC